MIVSLVARNEDAVRGLAHRSGQSSVAFAST